MVVSALGIGLTMSPATNSVMGAIPVSQSGVGSAMNNTTRQIGGALGVAVLGTLLNSNYISNINSYSWSTQIPSQAMAAIRAGVQGAHVVAQKFSGTPLAQTIIYQADTSFVNSAKYTMIVSAIIMAVAAVVTLVILPNRIRHHKPDDTTESD